MELVIIFGGVILFVAGFIAINIWFSTMRYKRMAKFGASIGFACHRSDTFDLPGR